MCEMNSAKRNITIIDTLTALVRNDGPKLRGNRLYYALSVKQQPLLPALQAPKQNAVCNARLLLAFCACSVRK